jgi:molecular chaperone HscB
MSGDYFSVFGLPRKLQVDAEALRRRFYELSRQHHPDFHQLAGADTQASALAASALVNRAYRALREPIARVEYLVALEEGRDAREGAAVKPAPPMDLLEEMLEVQEALEEAKTAGLDADARARLARERDRLVERRAATEREIIARGAEWDAAVDAGRERAPLLAWFKQALATRAYLRTVIEDLSEALGEESHVSHRRH